MNIIALIIKREYLTRVRKRSFLIMTILGPLLIFSFYAIIGWAAVSSINQKKIAVVDDSGRFVNKFKNDDETVYAYPKESLPEAKKSFVKQGYDALVFIPKNVIEEPKSVQIFAEKSVSLTLQSNIEKAISKEIETIKLSQAGITQQIIQDAKVNVDAQTISLSEEGERNSNAIAMTIIGYFCAFMIYISVFIYGTQVMRGVMEEKTNRIVEVIISSVKPFQLMLGKILGVALVGLTQFMLWILLTVGLFSVGGALVGDKADRGRQAMQASGAVTQAPAMASSQASSGALTSVVRAVETLNIPLIVACFLFYFLGGYLLYSALFGAIGAAVDNETETQQFMFPITLPIIGSIAVAQFVMRDPDGALAFWTSIIPFTSPVVMMVRIPFGVPVWELVLSMILLVLGFMGTTWLAARIYRVGILMYGKKVTYKELSKWLFYKA
ncbi:MULTISPECIES: ABC transporter permease [Spirosoma]|uniref:ABC transporter permease n=1 Tax=Spirosoma liriopis TaxID=2937440 RepID=A0ABT0HQ64_9BACT|nr:MULTISPECIES: ABC transporter permease [Spirosoma]MCK8494314.1 ABC transporter permease [Spirosoma liriopis]UHG89326.1 ABC transporter permease [Spirosoma oryzicola]